MGGVAPPSLAGLWFERPDDLVGIKCHTGERLDDGAVAEADDEHFAFLTDGECDTVGTDEGGRCHGTVDLDRWEAERAICEFVDGDGRRSD